MRWNSRPYTYGQAFRAIGSVMFTVFLAVILYELIVH